VGDFNGDGLADIASALGTQVYLKLNTGLDGPAGFTQVIGVVPNNWGASEYTWAGDFDGDGRADLLSGAGATAFFKFTTDAGFNEVEAFRPHFNWGGSGYGWVGDFDGDGRDDIARASGGNVYIDGVADR
jgi:hypothetical protein